MWGHMSLGIGAEGTDVGQGFRVRGCEREDSRAGPGNWQGERWIDRERERERESERE